MQASRDIQGRHHPSTTLFLKPNLIPHIYTHGLPPTSLQCMPTNGESGGTLARPQNSCSSARPDTSLIGTSHYMARPFTLSPPPNFLPSHSTPRYPSPTTFMLPPTLLATAFSTPIFIYLHFRPSPSSTSSCSTFTNPSRFVKWERLQMQLITNILDRPHTLNHDILPSRIFD